MTQTDYYVKRVLDAVFNGVPFTVDAPYVALGTSSSVEVSAPDYARKIIYWTPSTEAGLINSTNDVVWTPTSEWGTVMYAFLMDASQGGNKLFVSAVGPAPASAGSTIRIGAGDLFVT